MGVLTPIPSQEKVARMRRMRGTVNAEACLTASAAGDTHVARDGGFVMAAVDDEVMALGLASDRFSDGRIQQIIVLRGSPTSLDAGALTFGKFSSRRATRRRGRA